MKPSDPKFTGPRHTARSLAVQVLLACRRKDAFAGELLDQHLAHAGLPGPDRRLTTQLVYGVLRRRASRRSSRMAGAWCRLVI